MSEKIDWSKAPEGYPVWIQGVDTNFTSGWYRELSDRYESKKGTYYMKRDSSFFTANYRPTTPSWSGEGLPPVGVVCEANFVGSWTEFELRYYGESYVIFKTRYEVQRTRIDFDTCGVKFRPIRTPEQIAADEREAAIGEMVQAICLARCSLDCTPLSPADEAKCASAALYDAGYRKP